jgi:hypothetical protein
MRQQLEHGNHLFAKLAGQQHLPFSTVVTRLAVAAAVTVSQDRRAGLGGHDATAVVAAIDLALLLAVAEHPVDYGVAA